jgi:ADP-ribosylglycohydrolase
MIHRVSACFKALASGDAIGKQTETLTRAQVGKWYPAAVTGFHGRPGDVIPRYAGSRYEWRIGETTDDTEQTLAVARALLPDGEARHERVGKELLSCRKSVHPDLSIWRFQQHGDPAHIALNGDGCGAAMRVSPVGVIFRPEPLDQLVRAAYECSVPTHGGQMGISAAAAVAGAVSAALEGRPAQEVLNIAVAAARKAEEPRPPAVDITIASSIESIYSDLASRDLIDACDVARRYFPNNPAKIIPLAISLAVVTQSAEQTILLAANIGGDADSVASIGGAVAAALRPETVNEDWFRIVSAVNGEDILGVAAPLAKLRPH